MKKSPTPPVWLTLGSMIVLLGGMLAWLSVRRYLGYNAGMLDLGNMYQAIASVLRGQPLVVTSVNGNVSRLAGHVELIYYAFVPLVAIWRSPTTLLVAQSALVACGAFPAYRLAIRRLDSRMAARCVALIYLLYPVGLTAVLFDFHGDTLAMPLLLFALDAADRRAWRNFALWAALALSCKMYMALPIVGIGAYLFLWGGRRRAGLITVAAAVIYGAVVFFFLRELFRPIGTETSAASTYTKFYFGSLGDVGTTIGERILNALVVFGPALLMAWRGWRWLLVGAPLALAALISTGPGAGYDFRYHHYAAVVPFVVMAVVDGAEQSRRQEAGGRRRPRNWRGDLAFTTLVVGIITALMVDTPLNPTFWLNIPGMGLDPSIYGMTSRDALKDRFLAEYVPPTVPIAASMFLGAHLADRNMLYVVRYSDDPGGKRLPSILPKVDAVVADALFDWRTLAGETLLGGVDYEAQEIALLLRDPSFALRANRDGLLFFDRGGSGLRQEIVVGTDVTVPPQRADFGPIRMLGARVTSLGGRRYLAEFAWQLSGNVPTGRLLAISRIDGIPDARIVHLPSYLLLPTNQWQAGQVITERFEVELPTEVAPGSYVWHTAWYNPAHSEAYATDQRSQLSGSSDQEITRIEVRP
ncbi:MAG: DUF2079 domain-containing protein [Chloroflexales bacterium]